MSNSKNTKKTQSVTPFKQTNAFAMYNGLILGVFSILTQVCFVLGLKSSIASMTFLLMVLSFPFLSWTLTAKFRKTVALSTSFSFGRGFTHNFLSILYAGMWVGLATFFYFQFFDNGYVFGVYQTTLSSPEMSQALKESGLEHQIKETIGDKSLSDVIMGMSQISSVDYAGAMIYLYLLSAPPLALLGGLFNMRR